MQITRQADYAVRAVLFLSGLDNGRRAPTSEIARKQHIPPSFLAKIVSQLSVAGVVQTSRGARGGVSLARAADEISLLEVVEAIDGPIMLNECVFDANACVFGDDCPVQDVWCNAQETLVKTLRGTTFAALTHQ
ncbi:MAG: Rrf2 family transcriptional regulator [Anaerolineales bacterium]|nr:Rrf2 family transcriptional regulator [Anaerolineales bacterium]TET96027.1 MAG: Rrf2 family transcriptional regulator [Anaerolineales bacterium]